MKWKQLARVVREFKIEVGDLRVQGPPAAILALGGLVLAGGIARVMVQNAGSLPETLREAKGLIEALRSEPYKRLNS